MNTQEKFDFLMSENADLTEAENAISDRIKKNVKEIDAIDSHKKKMQIATEALIMCLIDIYDKRHEPKKENEGE